MSFFSNLHINSKMTIANFSTQKADSQKLLRVEIDRNSSFNKYVSNLSKQAVN